MVKLGGKLIVLLGVVKGIKMVVKEIKLSVDKVTAPA